MESGYEKVDIAPSNRPTGGSETDVGCGAPSLDSDIQVRHSPEPKPSKDLTLIICPNDPEMTDEEMAQLLVERVQNFLNPKAA
jgi:hypothetical protein